MQHDGRVITSIIITIIIIIIIIAIVVIESIIWQRAKQQSCDKRASQIFLTRKLVYPKIHVICSDPSNVYLDVGGCTLIWQTNVLFFCVWEWDSRLFLERKTKTSRASCVLRALGVGLLICGTKDKHGDKDKDKGKKIMARTKTKTKRQSCAVMMLEWDRSPFVEQKVAKLRTGKTSN